MDRITYLSAAQKDLSKEEIYQIGKVSQKNNAKDGISGVLLCYRGLFYQILEGDPDNLYPCLERIRKDPRHTDIVILRLEKNISQRRYQLWEMKTLILDNATDPLIRPVQDMLDLMTRSYRALERYVPLDVLEGIQQGMDPINWKLKRDQHIVMFVDLIGFSAMIERINDLNDLEMVMNKFFDIAAKAIDGTGGKLSKLLGDGFMAHYQLTQASEVLQAAQMLINKMRELREQTESPYLKLLYCGVGISAGPLVKGNIGTLKKDFTLLGEVVNSASRLESYTRRAGFHLLFDQRFNKILKQQKEWKVVKVGKFKPKGMKSKLTLYTLDDPHMPFDRTAKQITREINQI